MIKADENFQLTYNPETNTLKCNDEELACPLCGKHNKLHIMTRSITYDYEREYWIHCDECGLDFDAVLVALYNKPIKQPILKESDVRVWTLYFLDSYNHAVVKCFKTKCSSISISYILDNFNKICKKGDRYIAIVEVE